MNIFQVLLRKEYRLGLIGCVILALIIATSIFAPWLAPYDPFVRSGAPFAPPSLAHPLGCNDVGHDLLSELLYGGRISLTVGCFAAFFSTCLATLAAITAGYCGGWVDRLIMRIVDVILSLPFLPLVIVLSVFLGSGVSTQILIISTVLWAGPCRELRSQVLKTRHMCYVDASRAMGEKSYKIILRHTLHDIAPLIVPQFVIIAKEAILLESSLSFLGLGDPTLKSWGSMLFFANTRAAFLTGAWIWWVVPPGLLITLTCLSFALIGFAIAGKRGLEYAPYGSFKRLFLPAPRQLTQEEADLPLQVSKLKVRYNTRGGKRGKQADADENLAVSKASLSVQPGEVLGLVGESGCGKTTVAMAALALLRFPAEVTGGEALIRGTDMLRADQLTILKMRGKTVAYVPQNAMNALNPVFTVRKQLLEAIKIHRKLKRSEEHAEITRLLQSVGIFPGRADSYNHELSGGMKQRVVIAMALANKPDLLIADEPTTGLDVLVQKSILDLLAALKHEYNLAMLLITHDLPVAMHYSDRLAVMYKGEVVDCGPVDAVRNQPSHAHTKDLLNNFPSLTQDKEWSRAPSSCQAGQVLEAINLCKTFKTSGGIFQLKSTMVEAVANVSFQVRPGEVLGLIGESGSGKSTISRLLLGLDKPDSGKILLDGQEIQGLSAVKRRDLAAKIHLIFQDPYQSMRNSMRLFDIVAEPMRIQGQLNREQIRDSVCEAMSAVHLPYDQDFLNRTPDKLSGGQRQRVSFARAVVARPEYIIADEPTSMLDVSLRQELLKLMEGLRERYQIGYLFITHDLSLAYHFCDRIMVLQNGKVVESGEAAALISRPRKQYTQSLIAAVTPEADSDPLRFALQKSRELAQAGR